MTSEQFVRALKLAVRDPAISGTLQVLTEPPGRSPRIELREDAAWYASLTQSDRERLRSVLERAVDSALFGTLCVLDGVRAIESEPKGNLELRYVGQESVVLTSASQMLHDLY